MKIHKQISAMAGLTSALLIPLLLTACPPPPVAEPPAASDDPAAETSHVESWQCRNDLEVTCAEGKCQAETRGGFTPMSVDVDDSGAMSICAYSGCWEGTGEVVSREEFLVLIGIDLKFSTALNSDSAAQNIVIAIDRADRVAILKAGGFAHPLLCEREP